MTTEITHIHVPPKGFSDGRGWMPTAQYQKLSILRSITDGTRDLNRIRFNDSLTHMAVEGRLHILAEFQRPQGFHIRGVCLHLNLNGFHEEASIQCSWSNMPSYFDLNYKKLFSKRTGYFFMVKCMWNVLVDVKWFIGYMVLSTFLCFKCYLGFLFREK